MIPKVWSFAAAVYCSGLSPFSLMRWNYHSMSIYRRPPTHWVPTLVRRVIWVRNDVCIACPFSSLEPELWPVVRPSHLKVHSQPLLISVDVTIGDKCSWPRSCFFPGGCHNDTNQRKILFLKLCTYPLYACQQLHICVPVLLVFSNILLQLCNSVRIVSFDLLVHLRVACGCCQLLHLKHNA